MDNPDIPGRTVFEAAMVILNSWLGLSWVQHQKRHDAIEKKLDEGDARMTQIQLVAAKVPTREDLDRLESKVEDLTKMIYLTLSKHQKDQYEDNKRIRGKEND